MLPAGTLDIEREDDVYCLDLNGEYDIFLGQYSDEKSVSEQSVSFDFDLCKSEDRSDCMSENEVKTWFSNYLVEIRWFHMQTKIDYYAMQQSDMI